MASLLLIKSLIGKLVCWRLPLRLLWARICRSIGLRVVDVHCNVFDAALRPGLMPVEFSCLHAVCIFHGLLDRKHSIAGCVQHFHKLFATTFKAI